MNIAIRSIEKSTITIVLTVVFLVGGLISYTKLARLEDPEFTIKEALVMTPYDGASATEVAEEVSDEIEMAVQELGQLDEVESKSDRGMSTVTVRIKKQHMRAELPQIWDELRRKVNDAQSKLPPGAGPSVVMDDYADVWGVYLAFYGDEYTSAELKEFLKFLQRELLLVEGVAKVDFWGQRTEALYVEPKRERMSQLGVTMDDLVQVLRAKNIVSDTGRVLVGSEFIAIDPTGLFDEVKDFETLLIKSHGSDRQIYLRDVANLSRGYMEPPDKILRYDGKIAIGLGVSPVPGGNVVEMGEALEKRLHELEAQWPVGIQVGIVSFQSQAVTVAISGFVISLIEAVAIVIAVLLIFMGLRSGLIIGFVLLLTIAASFIFMGPMGVALERISLGALIIALGMLVDNAIVVTDGMLVRIQGGEDPKKSAGDIVSQTAIPLLGATIIAILAFAAIGTSKDSTGEFCRSLFQVVLISLGLSWITAVTVTPLLCYYFIKPPKQKEGEPESEPEDPYGGFLFKVYKSFLAFCIRLRWVTMSVVILIFLVSLWGFGYVDKSFFPDSTRPQFMVDMWMPQGTHINSTMETAQRVEEYLLEQEHVTHVSSLVGSGGMRFVLTYTPEKVNSAYMQFLVDVDDYKAIGEMLPRIEQELLEKFPNTNSWCNKFALGPGGGGKIQVRLSGPDPDVLRDLESQVTGIIKSDPGAKGIRSDWNQRVKVFRPILADEEANLAGITREDVAMALKSGFQGEKAGVYREGDELIPIVVRATEDERTNVGSVNNISIWSPSAGKYIPLRQVVSDFQVAFEDEIIVRLDRLPTITIHCDQKSGPASVVFGRLRPQIEALNYPTDYFMEWGGEYEDSAEAQQGLTATLPFFVLAMILIVIGLFNSIRQPLIIWLCVPLAIIGVTAGLLLTGQPFGFMALLGFLSLMGMLIKNAIVLIDEIETQKRGGKELFPAIVDSSVSRLRPVAMAASTTALGMIPLLVDAFFVAMAVTIIFGLCFATVLTMVVVPVLYAIFFKVPNP